MWDQFGLQRNPFEIKAIEIGGVVPPSTFVGREEDRRSLIKLIQSSEHSLNLIVGERGIGKTSLGNVARSDLFEEYFIPLGEIDTQHNWNSQQFVESALISFLESAYKASQHTDLSAKYIKTCQEIAPLAENVFVGKQAGFGAQVAGFGFETSSGRTLTKVPYALLKLKFAEIIARIIQHGYKGAIFQYNNLDNVEIDAKKLSRLFADLRDFLVQDNVHFLILGNKQMEEGIDYNKKVAECVTARIHIGPLSTDIIQQILKKRYEVFKIAGRLPSAPVNDDAIDLICKLYGGNIRQVFYSLKHAVIGMNDILGKTKSLAKNDIKLVLNTLAKKKIARQMDRRTMEVLNLIVTNRKDITNTEITRKLSLRPSNTSKYLKQLKDNNLIVQSDKVGQKIYYRPVHEAKWLLLNPENTTQTPLFFWGDQK